MHDLLLAVLGFKAVLFVIQDIWLHLRQHRVYVGHTKLPVVLEKVMSAETFAKARSYALDKSSFALWCRQFAP